MVKMSPNWLKTKNSIYIVALLSVALWFTWCTSDKRVDSEAVRQEIEDRKIKKVTEADIITRVYEIGDLVTKNAKATLGKNLQGALQQGGIEYAIGFCNLKAMPLVDSLSNQYQATIRRVTTKARNQNDLPDNIEAEILDAYAYQMQDSSKLIDNVQTISDSVYLFTRPIMIDNGLCLTCHGSNENGLLPSTIELITSKYPHDQATGYSMGDFRGMWSIRIPKKRIIQSMPGQ